MQKKSPFTIPKDYFQNLEEEVDCRLCELRLKERFGKQSGFIVPGEYFENFSAPKNAKMSRKSLSRILLSVASVAAAWLLLIGIWQVIGNQINTYDYRSAQAQQSENREGVTESDWADRQMNNYLSSFNVFAIAEMQPDGEKIEASFSDAAKEEVIEYAAEDFDYELLLSDL